MFLFSKSIGNSMILKAKAEGPMASTPPDSWCSYPLYHVHRMAPAICTCMHWMIRRLHDYMGKDMTIPPWAGFERIFLVGLCCWPCEVFFQFVLLSALYFSVLFWSALIHAIRLVLIVVLFFSSLTCFWTEK